MPTALAWFITFNFLNITWVFFRAREWGDAVKVLNGMFFGELVLHYRWFDQLSYLHGKVKFGAWLQAINADKYALISLLAALLLCLLGKNSTQIQSAVKYNSVTLAMGVFMLTFSLLKMHEVSEFLYFNF